MHIIRFVITGDVHGNIRCIFRAASGENKNTRDMARIHGHRIGYSAEARINRKDFGLTFNMMLDGKWIVSDEVQIFIEGEFVEQKQEPTA